MPNTEASTYTKQILTHMKGEINKNTIIAGDFNTSLSTIDSLLRKISKETLDLNYTLDKMDLTDIPRTFHSKASPYTFFSSTYKIYSKTDDTIGQKTSLRKFNKTEITANIFSDQNGMKPEINHRRKTGKFTNVW